MIYWSPEIRKKPYSPKSRIVALARQLADFLKCNSSSSRANYWGLPPKSITLKNYLQIQILDLIAHDATATVDSGDKSKDFPEVNFQDSSIEEIVQVLKQEL